MSDDLSTRGWSGEEADSLLVRGYVSGTSKEDTQSIYGVGTASEEVHGVAVLMLGIGGTGTISEESSGVAEVFAAEYARSRAIGGSIGTRLDVDAFVKMRSQEPLYQVAGPGQLLRSASTASEEKSGKGSVGTVTTPELVAVSSTTNETSGVCRFGISLVGATTSCCESSGRGRLDHSGFTDEEMEFLLQVALDEEALLV